MNAEDSAAGHKTMAEAVNALLRVECKHRAEGLGGRIGLAGHELSAGEQDAGEGLAAVGKSLNGSLLI